VSTLRFKEQDSPQTLREGLKEFYGNLGGEALALAEVDASVAQLMHAHDAAHVVFGCDTTLRGELLADSWTLAASTMTVGQYMAYLREPLIQEVFRSIPVGALTKDLVASLPRLAVLLVRSRQQREPWAFDAYREHLDRPLADIRAEFNIRVLAD
jgi:ubiquinone biosynthesis protein Coq4